MALTDIAVLRCFCNFEDLYTHYMEFILTEYVIEQFNQNKHRKLDNVYLKTHQNSFNDVCSAVFLVTATFILITNKQ